MSENPGIQSLMVTILICYKKGTSSMMGVCLEAIKRHTTAPYKLLCVTIDGRGADELLALGLKVEEILLINHRLDGLLGRTHGVMIDYAMKTVDTEYVLNLDSDCFPVSTGWLQELVDMLNEDNVGCAGIMFPWEPPPDDLSKSSTEYRIRNSHNWNVTWVACQLAKTSFIRDNNLKFAEGDDTGLTIPHKAKELGMEVVGWRANRCANSNSSDFDPEFNRYSCIIYGDRVYHHGEYTRRMGTNQKTFNEFFDWVLPIVESYEGAEFLLDDENSYKYKFDREKEVAKQKMDIMLGFKRYETQV